MEKRDKIIIAIALISVLLVTTTLAYAYVENLVNSNTDKITPLGIPTLALTDNATKFGFFTNDTAQLNATLIINGGVDVLTGIGITFYDNATQIGFINSNAGVSTFNVFLADNDTQYFNATALIP
jgi:hypothetical protein